MKKLTYIFLALALLSCEKEVDSNKEEQTTQESQKLMELQFEGEVFASSVTVTVNGQEIESMSTNVSTGDLVHIEAYNSCTSNGCPLIKSIIYIDGSNATEEYCYCGLLNYSYTIE